MKVLGRRLDELLAGQTVDLLKIDCEGSELDVLESLGAHAARVSRIAVEYHDQLLPDAGARVEGFLRSRGFDTSRLPDPYDLRLGYVYATASAP